MNTHRSLTSVDIVGGQDRVDVIEAYSEVVSDSLLAYDKDLIILSIFYKGVGPNHKRKKKLYTRSSESFCTWSSYYHETWDNSHP